MANEPTNGPTAHETGQAARKSPPAEAGAAILSVDAVVREVERIAREAPSVEELDRMPMIGTGL